MFGFEPEQDDLKEDKDFENGIWKKLGLSKYLCPTCGAHLKESIGNLICLNGCHLPVHWQKRFHKQMKEISKKLLKWHTNRENKKRSLNLVDILVLESIAMNAKDFLNQKW